MWLDLQNPKSVAILVRRHGMYVWGKTWEEAKRHGECLHYLFEVAISMKKLGMDFQSAPAPLRSLDLCEENSSKKRSRESSTATVNLLGGIKCVLLDIEGTTTPITFVKNILFPYSVKKFKTFLESEEYYGLVDKPFIQAKKEFAEAKRKIASEPVPKSSKKVKK